MSSTNGWSDITLSFQCKSKGIAENAEEDNVLVEILVENMKELGYRAFAVTTSSPENNKQLSNENTYGEVKKHLSDNQEVAANKKTLFIEKTTNMVAKIKYFYNDKFLSYRGAMIAFLVCLFNVAESLYFGQGTTLGFNRHPMSRAELVCDILCMLGLYLAAVMSIIDLLWTKARLELAVKRKVNKEKSMEEKNNEKTI